jgi:hypothetical protein
MQIQRDNLQTEMTIGSCQQKRTISDKKRRAGAARREECSEGKCVDEVKIGKSDASSSTTLWKIWHRKYKGLQFILPSLSVWLAVVLLLSLFLSLFLSPSLSPSPSPYPSPSPSSLSTTTSPSPLAFSNHSVAVSMQKVIPTIMPKPC